MANPVNGGSTDTKVAAVKGECTGSGGFGVWGICATGHGVHGDSTSSRGVVGTSETFHGVFGHSKDNVGVAGESDTMWGVLGVSNSAGGIGVHGKNDVGGDGVVGVGRRGVVGQSQDFQGVYGVSTGNAGVVGESTNLHGVFGVCHNPNGAGTFGVNDQGGMGVEGFCDRGRGVWGHSDTGDGVIGESKTGIAVHGKGGRLAAFFEGDVEVTGDIRLTNADCAEDFDIAEADLVEAGTVVVLRDEGVVSPSRCAYDKRVAGVISGAGNYRPGIVLDKQQSSNDRMPVALLGKVFCKVDASHGAIEVGDLLTTSPTLGYAMRASDPVRAFGAVIGKALRPLKEGQSLIPILISLQ